MDRHPEFTNLDTIGRGIARQDRFAIARHSVLTETGLSRIFRGWGSGRQAAPAARRRHRNAGLLLAELDRFVAALPRL